jgi:hypothetical protein
MSIGRRIAVCLVALAPALAHADDDQDGRKPRIDTEFIFGFTAGADTGEVGEKELEHQTATQLGKRNGNYAALADQLRFETSPVPNFRFEIGAPISYYGISDVPGLDDRNQGNFNGLVAEFKYRLLDRDHAPFSMMISAEPHWKRVDEISGEHVDSYGGELTLAVDKELVRNRVFAAVNFIYEPEIMRIRARWDGETTLTASTSVATQIEPGVFFGAEARYLRKYDGINLEALVGRALYVGPTTYIRLTKRLAFSAAWSVQVAGRAVIDPRNLDLTSFTRQQALFRFEYNF